MPTGQAPSWKSTGKDRPNHLDSVQEEILKADYYQPFQCAGPVSEADNRGRVVTMVAAGRGYGGVRRDSGGGSMEGQGGYGPTVH